MANFISNNINKPTVEELTTFTNYNTLFFNKDEDILIEVKNDDTYYYTHKIKLKDLKNLTKFIIIKKPYKNYKGKYYELNCIYNNPIYTYYDNEIIKVPYSNNYQLYGFNNNEYLLRNSAIIKDKFKDKNITIYKPNINVAECKIKDIEDGNLFSFNDYSILLAVGDKLEVGYKYVGPKNIFKFSNTTRNNTPEYMININKGNRTEWWINECDRVFKDMIDKDNKL